MWKLKLILWPKALRMQVSGWLAAVPVTIPCTLLQTHSWRSFSWKRIGGIDCIIFLLAPVQGHKWQRAGKKSWTFFAIWSNNKWTDTHSFCSDSQICCLRGNTYSAWDVIWCCVDKVGHCLLKSTANIEPKAFNHHWTVWISKTHVLFRTWKWSAGFIAAENNCWRCFCELPSPLVSIYQVLFVSVLIF